MYVWVLQFSFNMWTNNSYISSVTALKDINIVIANRDISFATIKKNVDCWKFK